MNPETAVIFTCGHFNQVVFAVAWLVLMHSKLTAGGFKELCTESYEVYNHYKNNMMSHSQHWYGYHTALVALPCPLPPLTSDRSVCHSSMEISVNAPVNGTMKNDTLGTTTE